jgi:hypothetical protein
MKLALRPALLLCSLCCCAVSSSAAPPQPPATLITNAINMSSFLARADMVWDWQLHANVSEVDASYGRHAGACAPRAADPFYRRLAGSVSCHKGNLSACVSAAVALCDANEWCAAVQRNGSSPDDELLLFGSAFPLYVCGEGTTWTKSAYDRAPTTFNQGGWVGGGLLGWQVRTTRAAPGAPFGSALRIDVGRRDVWDTRAPGSPHSVNGALLDGGPNALVSGRLNSNVDGRYVFAVRNGTVVDPEPTQVPVPGALPLLLSGLALAVALGRRRRG